MLHPLQFLIALFISIWNLPNMDEDIYKEYPRVLFYD